MGSSCIRVLVLFALVGSLPRTVRGQSVPPLDELCQLPAPALAGAGAKAERDVQLRRAAVAFEKDRYAESLIALRAAYAAAPGADILFNMGQACLAAGQIEEALALYTRAQSESTSQETTATITNRLEQLRPRLAKALTLKAILLGSQEKHAEACAVWSRAYALDPQPLYLLKLADALRQADKSEEALILYERLSNLSSAADIVEVARRRVLEMRQPVAASATPSAAAVPVHMSPPLASAPPAPAALDVSSSRINRAPVYRRWWFWTALIGATVTVGLAVGLGTKVALDQPSYPDLRHISF